jgi:glycosyltransferase involved in cell wall biosynthesis
LTPWALAKSRFRKAAFWRLFQARSVQDADLLHATARSEYDDLRRLGLRQPICLLPNGVTIPDLPADSKAQGGQTLLYFGRLDPKKGVDILLRVWQRLQRRRPDWRLEIVGPCDSEYGSRLQRMASQLGLDRVRFAGPLYGGEKWRALRNADLFVLPSHSENFGIAVAEALASGTPVVVSRGTPWEGVVSHSAGWWIGNCQQELEDGLAEAMSTSTEIRRAMGRRGRLWMEREFSWETVARRMVETYRWLITGGAPPPWVYYD